MDDDPPPYEEEPLIRLREPLDQPYDPPNSIRTLINHPTCFIAVFCTGAIILSVLVTIIVVFGRRPNAETTIHTTTTTVTTTTTTTATTTIATTTTSTQAGQRNRVWK